MSKFFVGQRVRVVLDIGGIWPHLVGMEGRITEIQDNFLDGRPLFGLDIQGIVNRGRYADGFDADELEPILPSGHRAGEEGKCELLDRLLERQREAA